MHVLKVTNNIEKTRKSKTKKEKREKVDLHKRLNRIQVCLPERDI